MTDADMIAECAMYLKPGETPRQRMDRDHADVLNLMKMLAMEKKKDRGDDRGIWPDGEQIND